MIHVWISCDRCNGIGNSARMTGGRGVLEADESLLEDYDWELRDGQHICSECLDEEDKS